MPQDAPTFLALRYLRPKRSFVSVITLVSLTGVAVGVLMMVVVKSVMLGFDADFRETLLGAEPHLLLERAAETGEGEEGWQEMLAAVQAHPQTVSASAYAGGILYARFRDRQTGFPVLGLDLSQATGQLDKLRRHLLEGNLNLEDGTIVLSSFAASQLGAAIGDEITVYESLAVNRAARQFKTALDEPDAEKKKALHREISLGSSKLRVAGLLRGETGGFIAYTSLGTGRELFHLGASGMTRESLRFSVVAANGRETYHMNADGVTGVAVELKSPYEAREIGQALCPPGWRVRTWLDAGEARLAAMRNEQILMTVVLWIIAVVAAFAVMNTTITVTTQKRKEIGVLTALGCRTADIVRIFTVKAAVIGGLGVLAGLALSLLVLWLRNDIRGLIAQLTASQVHAIEGVFLAEIPARLSWLNVALAAGGSFILCLLAGFLPAWFAARLEPAQALRD